ncbi:MAG: hypothetical protein LBE38_10610 [Deltaproteobacteria bacterium]|jgi:hypothetical protein|nr:hypothetical protein [Deltaproteobacteria bacterium]
MLEKIALDEITKEFKACWSCAVAYVKRLGDKDLSWFKANLYSPLFEHFSFRLGNQLFFVRLEDKEGRLLVPGTLERLFTISEACHGHALIMPMRSIGGIWLPSEPGWGLLDARTYEPVNPKNLVTTEQIPYTDWELHDMAVHTIALSLPGKKLLSFSNHPSISPSIWYEGDSGTEWVIVRYAKHPELDAVPPGNWEDVCESCYKRSMGLGFFGVVVFAERSLATGVPTAQKELYRGGNIIYRINPLRVFRKKLPITTLSAPSKQTDDTRQIM